jgi:hypothetical protein
MNIERRHSCPEVLEEDSADGGKAVLAAGEVSGGREDRKTAFARGQEEWREPVSRGQGDTCSLL